VIVYSRAFRRAPLWQRYGFSPLPGLAGKNDEQLTFSPTEELEQVMALVAQAYQ